MARVMSADEAREHFDDLLRLAGEAGETVTIEREGAPVVVVLPAAEFRRLDAVSREAARLRDVDDMFARLDAVRARTRAELGGRSLPPVEDIIHEMREERDRQLLDGLLGREPGGEDRR
jgi:prevent-host-death family protein